MEIIKWVQVEPVLRVIQKLLELPDSYGEKYTYSIKADYRKNEYVFGVSLKCDLGGNLCIEDYTSVVFSDSDNNEVNDADILDMINNIDSFIEKVEALKLLNK